MTGPVLVLGGTTEARRLADRIPVCTSLAGVTARPHLPDGPVRTGAFADDSELAGWVAGRGARAMVDATHPFADRITASAARVATRLGVPFVVLRRPGWTPGEQDHWHWVDSVAAAATRIRGLGTRVLLTVGRTELAPFAAVEDAWFLVRSIEEPAPPLPPRCEVLRARGPFSTTDERELFGIHGIDLVVTKDSGGQATAGKLVAARERGAPVLIVRRPPVPAGVLVLPTVEDVLGWLHALPG